MNKCLFLYLISINFLSYAQIIIDKSDMPVPGKYYNLSNNITVKDLDFTKTGNNYTWDFSSLSSNSQVTDSFVNVNATPAIYKYVFNNNFDIKYKATVAQPQNTLNLVSELNLSDVYNFYKLSDNSFSQVGLGGSLNSIQIPIKFDNPDIIYKLPLKSGNIDSNISSFSILLTGIGYLSQIKHRKNTVDGWGTLITPFGFFQSLRVKSEITETDSVYMDSLGIPFPAINRNYIEYKWLVKGFSVPVLQITQEGIRLNISYIDSIRKTLVSEYFNKSYLNVFPNPATDKLNIKYKLNHPSEVKITLYNIFGVEIKKIENCYKNEGFYNKCYDIKKYNINAGIYLLNIKTYGNNLVQKIFIY